MLVSEKEFIHNTYEMDEILDPNTYANHRCVRECTAGAEPMICEYTFHVRFKMNLIFVVLGAGMMVDTNIDSRHEHQSVDVLVREIFFFTSIGCSARMPAVDQYALSI